VREILAEHRSCSEEQVAWQVIEEMAVRAAALLQPIYETHNGQKGRLSLQTNPTYYRDAEAIVRQALHFASLAPNLHVKIPVTRAGIEAIEEATYRGISINGTVSFTVPQAIAVAEAVERGLNRRTAEGHDISTMRPTATLMIGRLDDWMQVLVKRDGIIARPEVVHWAGIACMKKTYGIFRTRGYRSALLAAAYRHHLHWSELIGGDLALTMPYAWQRLFSASDVEVKDRFFDPVPSEIVSELCRKFPDFRRAYDEDGLTVEEFDAYPATVRTLRAFIGSYRDLLARIRDFMLPNPDNA
jgi:transaldolase